MDTARFVQEHRDEILRIAAQRGASNVRVFGSFARGDAREDSDIDLLVELEKGRGLWAINGLAADLEDALGRKVDLVTEGGLDPYLKDRIMAEARPL